MSTTNLEPDGETVKPVFTLGMPMFKRECAFYGEKLDRAERHALEEPSEENQQRLAEAREAYGDVWDCVVAKPPRVPKDRFKAAALYREMRVATVEAIQASKDCTGTARECIDAAARAKRLHAELQGVAAVITERKRATAQQRQHAEEIAATAARFIEVLGGSHD